MSIVPYDAVASKKNGVSEPDMVTSSHTIGWIGTGRMGYALVKRLLGGGCDVSVYNRTRAKAEPLADLGAKIVDLPSDLADRDLVFTMVAGPDDVLEVTLGGDGVLSDRGAAPRIIIDSTTINPDASSILRRGATERGTAVLAAPVSGNPKVVGSGMLTVVASGPRDAYEVALPYLELYGKAVTYVGPADEARLVKICHNLFLGVMTQALAEITVLAERGGVSRADLLAFLNDSVLGSTFSRYKTPAFVNLDFAPTFTWHLLLKDFDLGLEQSRELNVPLPASTLVHGQIMKGIDLGLGDLDFAALLELAADAAGIELEPENIQVGDGLS